MSRSKIYQCYLLPSKGFCSLHFTNQAEALRLASCIITIKNDGYDDSGGKSHFVMMIRPQSARKFLKCNVFLTSMKFDIFK